MSPLSKDSLGWLSVAFAVVSYVPYIRGILKGKFKPHVFSWFVWTIIVCVVFAAQWVKGAGAGSWTTGFSGVMCLVLTVLGLTHGERTITRGDWAIFLGALLSLPLWWITDDPVWSVVLLTAIDVSAYYPTFRKSWKKPFEESAFSCGVTGVKFVVAIAALEQFNVTTALFPAAMTVTCLLLTAMLLWRRKQKEAGA